MPGWDFSHDGMTRRQPARASTFQNLTFQGPLLSFSSCFEGLAAGKAAAIAAALVRGKVCCLFAWPVGLSSAVPKQFVD